MSLQLTQHITGDPGVSFVASSLIGAPNTSVQNRALIRDMANDMGPRMGIERIPVQAFYEIPNEFGPNGERVYGALNDERQLIRFVGLWNNGGINTSGQYVQASTSTTDYVEITFFGTGLNILTLMNGAYDFRATIDGGSEGGNLAVSGSTAQVGRSVSVNQIVNVATGLSQGLHTIKIRNNSATPLLVYGFEILNETATVRINPGKYVKDQRQVNLESPQSLLAKPTALTGVRGGRVVVYNAGGSISQAIQAVDPAAQYLTSANHTNEEIARVHHVTEFGAGRTDDFSIGSNGVADRAHTLEDGTTTLTASGAFVVAGASGIRGISLTGTSDYVNLTFVGTGLDAVIEDYETNARYEITVDGTIVGTRGAPTALNLPYRYSLVSGLPYGTHIVRIRNASLSGATNDSGYISKFIVYQPKKPSIPANAVELADYNVMANFAASAGGFGTVATGVLAKTNTREAVLFGAQWSIGAASVGNYPMGFALTAGAATGTGSYVEYTFFGTGFDLRFFTNGTYSASCEVRLNGILATAANFPSATIAVTSPATFNTSTAILAQNVANGADRSLSFSGLPLGKYTFRITQTGGAAYMDVASFHIITPIHSPRSSTPGDLQNTLPIGSCGLSDSRQLSIPTGSVQKAWAQAIGPLAASTATNTSYHAVPGMGVTIKTGNSKVSVRFSIGFNVSATNVANSFQIYIDGAPVGAILPTQSSNSTTNVTAALQWSGVLSAGTHRIEVYSALSGGTVSWQANTGTLTVEET